MSKHPKINVHRRRVMKFITKNLGSRSKPKRGNLLRLENVKRVLIIRTNHRLGNLLLITPIVQDVITTFPNAKIDLIIQGGLGPTIFNNYKEVDTIISLPKKPFKNLGSYAKGFFSVFNKKYDFVINAVGESSSGKLYTSMSRSKFKVFGVDSRDNTTHVNYEKHIAKAPVVALRHYLNQIGFNLQNQNIPTLDVVLSPDEINKGKTILKDVIGTTENVVSLFTFATADKCYKPDWWLPFYEKLLKTFPEYQFIEILPYENVSQINFQAPAYYSKDIREMAAVMRNTALWIGADCGIMHLASAANVTCVGLFSKPNYDKYKPYNSRSFHVYTGETDTDGIIDQLKKVLP